MLLNWIVVIQPLKRRVMCVQGCTENQLALILSFWIYFMFITIVVLISSSPLFYVALSWLMLLFVNILTQSTLRSDHILEVYCLVLGNNLVCNLTLIILFHVFSLLFPHTWCDACSVF